MQALWSVWQHRCALLTGSSQFGGNTCVDVANLMTTYMFIVPVIGIKFRGMQHMFVNAIQAASLVTTGVYTIVIHTILASSLATTHFSYTRRTLEQQFGDNTFGDNIFLLHMLV